MRLAERGFHPAKESPMPRTIGPRYTGGFTLAELVIAIMIMGVIAVLSVPAVAPFLQSWKLKGEAQQMASVLRSARSAAVMKNINAVFTFNPASGTYSYFEDNDRDGTRDLNEFQSATFRLVPQVTIAAFTLPGTSLTFGPMGNTRANGALTLQAAHNRSRTIRVFSGTGNVTVD
jgi:prepilin-type N-terminal cleavage/methylation domain-containing protein